MKRSFFALSFLVFAALLGGCAKPAADNIQNNDENRAKNSGRVELEDLTPKKIQGRCRELKALNTSVPRENCTREYTVLVYFAADNDLAPYALEDLYEMESRFDSGKLAGSTEKMDVVAELDLPGNAGIDRLHVEQQNYAYDSKVILNGTFTDVSAGRAMILSPVVKHLDENYLATQSERLESFLKWSIKMYPSERYFLVLWGHGQGWGSQNSTHGGVLFDDNPKKDFIDLVTLRKTLANVRDFSLNGKKFDLLVNDACLMQTVEVLSELKDEARFILGSTQIQNFHGLPYRRWFYSINASHFAGVSVSERKNRCGEDRSCWQAYLLPRLVKGTWTERGLQGQLDEDGRKQFTFSSFETSYFSQDLEPALNRLGAQLFRFAAEKDNTVQRQQSLFKALNIVPKYDGGSAEVGHLLSSIEENVREFEDKFGEDSASYSLKYGIGDVEKKLIYSNVSYYYGSDYLLGSQYPLGGGTRVLSIWTPAEFENYNERIEEFKRSSRFYIENSWWPKWLASVFEDTGF